MFFVFLSGFWRDIDVNSSLPKYCSNEADFSAIRIFVRVSVSVPWEMGSHKTALPLSPLWIYLPFAKQWSSTIWLQQSCSFAASLNDLKHSSRWWLFSTRNIRKCWHLLDQSQYWWTPNFSRRPGAEWGGFQGLTDRAAAGLCGQGNPEMQWVDQQWSLEISEL